MDPRLFRPEPMGLGAQFLEAPIETRITFDADRDLLLVNLRLRCGPAPTSRPSARVEALVAPSAARST